MPKLDAIENTSPKTLSVGSGQSSGIGGLGTVGKESALVVSEPKENSVMNFNKKEIQEIIKVYLATQFQEGNSNISNGKGTNSIQENMPHETITFNAIKNPNAVALDEDLNADLPTGASGNQSTAVGKDTMALGINTLTNGNKTVAKGDESHAEGYQSVTLGDGSHAEGEQTTTVGSVSHAEGSNTVSGGVASHAEGVRSQTKAFDGITDSGTGTHAEGESTIASGYCSHTEGFGSYTGKIENAPSYPDIPDEPGGGGGGGTPVEQVGNAAHAEGNYCRAIGTGSHAEGYHTSALHEAAHTEGVGTKSSREGQTVVGSYNADDADALFIIGKGTADDARSNAFSVLVNGSIKVGNTVITEAQLIALLNLLN